MDPLEARKPARWALLRRRQIILPTWRGWVLLLAFFALVCAVGLRHGYRFLAVTESIPGGVLVVEGWAPDCTMRQAIDEFRSNRYEMIFVTGVPVDYGGPLSSYKTYAEIGSATLIAMGMDSNVVQGVSAPEVRRDRTYASAAALAKWFNSHSGPPLRLNLMTEGPHARRSRLLFQRALGPQTAVGIIAIQPRDYQPTRWWRYSSGVRNVTSEFIAYFYAKLIFRPGAE
jgi:hypothetical protein